MSTQELTAALARLTTAEQAELLRLLEHHRLLEAEQVVDDRPMWDDGHTYLIPTPPSRRVPNRTQQVQFQAAVTRSLDAAAARSTEPEAFKSAWARYKPMFDKHFGALSDAAVAEAEARGEPADMFVIFDQFDALSEQAKARTVRDGYEDPHDTFSPPVPEPKPEADPLGAMKRAAMRRAPLARDELLDQVLGRTEDEARARRAEAVAKLAADAELAQAEKLSWFKGPDASSMPPAFPDS